LERRVDVLSALPCGNRLGADLFASLLAIAANDCSAATSDRADHATGAVALGWAVGGETFSLWSLLGACLVLAGVWMIFRKGDEPEPVIQEG